MIEIRVANPKTEDFICEALIVPVFEGESPFVCQGKTQTKAFLKSSGNVFRLNGAAEEFGKLILMDAPQGFYSKKIVFVWLGSRKMLTPLLLKEAFGSAQRYLEGFSITDAGICYSKKLDADGFLESAIEGYCLASYKFEKYRSSPKNLKHKFSISTEDPKLIRNANAIAESLKQFISALFSLRDFVNEPPNVVNPAEIKKRCLALSGLKNVKVKVFDTEDLKAKGLNSILAVGRGSEQGAMLIAVEYTPRNFKRKVALIGKGVTFDSGGYSLKGPKDMLHMKGDMLGAAMVMTAIEIAATTKAPIAIVGLLPVVENLIGPAALKPDEVIKTYSGKTVEITNTDAEGRMLLADALAYAKKYNPDEIIDIATISGISNRALGDFMAPFFTNNERLANMFEGASLASGESFLRIPLMIECLRYIKSDLADLKNASVDTGGVLINPALFLSQFVGEVPWIHVDLAGVDFHAGDLSPIYPKGSSGFGTKTILKYLELI